MTDLADLIARRQAPRTLRSHLARVVVPRVTLFGALAAAILVGNAMALTPSAAPLDRDPISVPTWSAAEQAAEPDCVPAAEWPVGAPGAEVVVHRFADRSVDRMVFLDAWRVNHNDSESDDVWVLGICP